MAGVGGEGAAKGEREQKAVARGWLEKSHHKLGIWQKPLILCQGFGRQVLGLFPASDLCTDQPNPAQQCATERERRRGRGKERGGRKGWKGRGETAKERDTGREKEERN